MKKLLAMILSSMIVCTAAGCAAQPKDDAASAAETAAATEAVATTAAPETTAAATPAISPELEETIKTHEFEGVIYAVKNGQPTAVYATGTTENGSPITLDTPLPIGSVSKQFCAAAIMKLQEQGKLSVTDTLDKYYPDYAQGNKLTLHNLLSMRSGIPELTEESGVKVTMENTEAQNVAAIKEWLFKQPLQFEPDDAFAYANTNYFLLADIVEQVSGKPYIEFLRESFFTPLGMTHTGAIGELSGSPDWAQGNVYQQVDAQPGMTKGAGDLISNAADVTVWINALSSGKAISADSFKAMSTDYSPETHYGYGLFLELQGGVGHYGAIGIYSAFDYVNTDQQLTVVALANTVDPPAMSGFAEDLLSDLGT